MTTTQIKAELETLHNSVAAAQPHDAEEFQAALERMIELMDLMAENLAALERKS